MSNCPCCSGKIYKTCCEPFISGKRVPTALSLMRSRYTAYAICNAEYIYNTTHSKTQVESSIKEIENWAKENIWTKLEIINHENGTTADIEGTVEFKAHFTDVHGKKQIHHESSVFLKENDRWLYLEGIANPQAINTNKKVSRNDPCPCGSGKKYKKCCG